MGLFDRLSGLLRSNINDLISRAEDPEKMLNQILVDMRSQLAKAKQQVATAIADEKRLRDQADGEYRQGADWEKRAMLALQEGREDLAKQANAIARASTCRMRSSSSRRGNRIDSRRRSSRTRSAI